MRRMIGRFAVAIFRRIGGEFFSQLSPLARASTLSVMNRRFWRERYLCIGLEALPRYGLSSINPASSTLSMRLDISVKWARV